jgi:rod shape-determining protein MreC
VGVVTSVRNNSADVSYITEQGTSVGAYVLEDENPPGLLSAIEDDQMLLRNVSRKYRVRRGDVVLTSGFNEPGLPSIYPRGIPIGSVESVGRQESDSDLSIQVQPFAEVQSLHRLVILAPVSDDALRRARG